MDDEKNPERRQSEPADHLNLVPPSTESISLGASTANGADADVAPVNNGDATTAAAAAAVVPPPAQPNPNAKTVQDVLTSEIGISTLLNRLKQSIASAKEFALFLKKRSTLQDEHSNGLRKLCRVSADSIRRPECRHGSFLQAYDEVTSIHERMADNEAQFAVTLHQMHEDLLEMAATVERGRKQWKTSGLAAEQRVADIEAAMRKSKSKYDSLADDYDRARTGDRQAGKIFGLKGPKSAAQHEEDLLRKVQAADADYAAKVQTAQSSRSELLSKLRPEAVKALEDLTNECDSALTLQMQKFASFNEKLLLSNGLNVSPLKSHESGSQPRSLREAVYAIDNERDLSNYICSFAGKVPPKAPEIKYERSAVLNLTAAAPAPQPQRQSAPQTSFGARPGPPQAFGAIQSPSQPSMDQSFSHGPPSSMQSHERSFSQGNNLQQHGAGAGAGSMGGFRGPPGPPGPQHGSNHSQSISASGPPQLSTLPFQTSVTAPSNLQLHQAAAPSPYSPPPTQANNNHLPPLKPVFGLSLEQLFERDGSAVPMVVYQCIQAVDLYGLETEGIYRLSGTQSHITKLRAMFDNDASKVDFRNPESFFHDVNSVAGLLKQYFRDLPDPLLTAEHYAGFIEASRNEDDIVRRDSLHAIINSLPDPNYATLRALTLHLNRVHESSSTNRMNASNLAIVFGPTLMGANTGPNIQDAGWQVRVIDTILQNTYQIFDDD